MNFSFRYPSFRLLSLHSFWTLGLGVCSLVFLLHSQTLLAEDAGQDVEKLARRGAALLRGSNASLEPCFKMLRDESPNVQMEAIECIFSADTTFLLSSDLERLPRELQNASDPDLQQFGGLIALYAGKIGNVNLQELKVLRERLESRGMPDINWSIFANVSPLAREIQIQETFKKFKNGEELNPAEIALLLSSKEPLSAAEWDSLVTRAKTFSSSNFEEGVYEVLNMDFSADITPDRAKSFFASVERVFGADVSSPLATSLIGLVGSHSPDYFGKIQSAFEHRLNEFIQKEPLENFEADGEESAEGENLAPYIRVIARGDSASDKLFETLQTCLKLKLRSCALYSAWFLLVDKSFDRWAQVDALFAESGASELLDIVYEAYGGLTIFDETEKFKNKNEMLMFSLVRQSHSPVRDALVADIATKTPSKDPKLRRHLLEIVEKDSESDASSDAMEALASNEDVGENIELYLDLLKKVKNVKNRAKILEALSSKNLSAEEFASIRDGLTSEDDHIRYHTLRAYDWNSSHLPEGDELTLEEWARLTADMGKTKSLKYKELIFWHLASSLFEETREEILEELMEAPSAEMRLGVLNLFEKYSESTVVAAIADELQKDFDELPASLKAFVLDRPSLVKEGDLHLATLEVEKIEVLRRLANEKLFSETFPPSSAPDNSCTAICSILEKQSRWSKNTSHKKAEWKNDELSWELAMASLKSAFLLRALPICAPEKSSLFRAALAKAWSSEEKNPIKTLSAEERKILREYLPEFPQMHQNAAVLLEDWGVHHIKNGAKSRSPTETYAMQYMASILPSLIRSDVGDRQAQSLEALYSKLKGHLYEDFMVENHVYAGGSHMNTYAWSTTALFAQDNAELLSRLQALNTKVGETGLIPYSPDYDINTATERGSVARSIPFRLALYQKDAAGRAGHAEKLFAASETYIEKYFSDLVLHMTRDATHMNRDALAPYYFYSTVPYLSSALAQLEGDSTGKRKSEIQKLQANLAGKLTRMMSNGEAYAMGGKNPRMSYDQTQRYSNPLLGLALIPLAESCAPDGAEIVGVVPPGLLSQPLKAEFPEGLVH